MFYTSIPERLHTQHLALKEIIRPLDVNALNQQPQPGKWSVMENIAHLASYQPVFLKRVQQMIAADGATFDPYVGDTDPLFLSMRTQAVETVLAQYNDYRKEINELLESIPEEKLAHTGLHKVYGRLNITQWTEMYLLHEAHHLFTILKMTLQANSGK